MSEYNEDKNSTDSKDQTHKENTIKPERTLQNPDPEFSKIEEIKQVKSPKNEIQHNPEVPIIKNQSHTGTTESKDTLLAPKTPKRRKKRSKREKILEILKNIYKHSLYSFFISNCRILEFGYLTYQRPSPKLKPLNCFVIVTDFGIFVLIKKEYFVDNINWYNEEEEDQNTQGDEPIPLAKTLPFNREYFCIPYTLIEDINNHMNNMELVITTKVTLILKKKRRNSYF